MDDLEDIDALLSEIEQENGWKIPLHVDAASGGFVLPFYAPERVWDFRLKNVRSINVSNHKFGLVYPGMGTVVFRDKSDLPDELIFHINYLGGDMPNYSLNFSRPSKSVLLQYFAFLRLGREGYERVTQNVIGTARFLFDELGRLGEFDLMNEGLTIPVVPIKAKDPEKVDVFALSERLRERGWIVPAYTLPPNADDIAVLRIVVKENFSRDMAELLVADIDAALKRLGGRGEGDKARAGKARQPVC